MKIKISILIMTLCVLSFSSNAQDWGDKLGKKLEKKLEDKAKRASRQTERKIDQKIDKGIDKTVDEVLSGKWLKKERSTKYPTTEAVQNSNASKEIVNIEKNIEDFNINYEKGDVDAAITNMEKAESYLEKAKIKDENYDYSEYEKEIKEMKSLLLGDGNSSKSAEIKSTTQIKTVNNTSNINPGDNEIKPKSSNNTESNSNEKPEKEPTCVKNLKTEINKKNKNADEKLAQVNEGKEIQEINLNSELSWIKSEFKYCKKTNESYDFSSLEKEIEDLENKLKLIQNKAKEVNNKEARLENNAWVLRRYKLYIETKDYLKDELYDEFKDFNNDKVLEFENYSQSEENFYKNTIKPAQANIIEIKELLNGSEFQNNCYKAFDNLYANGNSESLEKIRIISSRLEHLKAVFCPTQNNEKLNELIAYANKLSGKITSKFKDVAVSDFHANNMNKIFFTSNVNLDPKTASASDFKTKFQAGENIKGILYLEGNYSTIFGESTSPQIYINTSNPVGVVEDFTSADRNLSYVEFYLVQEYSNYKNTVGLSNQIAYSMEFLTGLPPRSQDLEISISPWGGGSGYAKSLKGEFSFDASNDAGIAKMNKNRVLIENKFLESVKVPKAEMRNATYEAQLIKTFNSIGWDEKFTKAIIVSKDWTYKKSYTGKIVGRTLNVVMCSKKSDGTCMYQEFTVIQDKIDSGYGSFKREGTGSQVKCSCKNI